MKDLIYRGSSSEDVKKWAKEHINLAEAFFDHVLALRQDFCVSVVCMLTTGKDFYNLLPNRTYTVSFSKWEGWKIEVMVQ